MRFNQVALAAFFWLASLASNDNEKSSSSVASAFIHYSSCSTVINRKPFSSPGLSSSGGDGGGGGVMTSSRKLMSMAPDEYGNRDRRRNRRGSSSSNDDDVYEEEYAQWCFQYGKKFDHRRFQIFQDNMIQMENYMRKTGQRLSPNEYSDLSTQEYNRVMEQQNRSSFSSGRRASSSRSNDHQDEAEGSEYRDWCKANGKPMNDYTYDQFRSSIQYKQHHAQLSHPQQKQQQSQRSQSQPSFQSPMNSIRDRDPWRQRHEAARMKQSQQRSFQEEDMLRAQDELDDFNRQSRMSSQSPNRGGDTNKRRPSRPGGATDIRRTNDPEQQTRVKINDTIQNFGSHNLHHMNLNDNKNNRNGRYPQEQDDFHNDDRYNNKNNDYYDESSSGPYDGPLSGDYKLERDFSYNKNSQPKRFDQTNAGDPYSRTRVNKDDAIQSFGRNEWQQSSSSSSTRSSPARSGDGDTRRRDNYGDDRSDYDAVKTSSPAWANRPNRRDTMKNRRGGSFQYDKPGTRDGGEQLDSIDQSNMFNLDNQVRNKNYRSSSSGASADGPISSARHRARRNEEEDEEDARREALEEEEQAKKLSRMTPYQRMKAEKDTERAEIERVRNAYDDWCSKYGRTFDEDRVNNFAANFYKMEEYQKATGKIIELNQHSDLTSAEYQIMQEEEREREEEERHVQRQEQARSLRMENEKLQRMQVEKETSAERDARERFEESARRKQMRMEKSLFDLNECYAEFEKHDTTSTGGDASYSTNKMKKVRHAYNKWCEFYDRPHDESRLNIFASNAKKVAKYYKSTGVSMNLNGYADRTVEEYRDIQKARDMAMGSGFLMDNDKPKNGNGRVSFSDADYHSRGGRQDLKRIRNAYTEWCLAHDKEFDEVRFVNFANNLRQMEKFQKATGKAVELNEWSDMTAEEYNEAMKSGTGPTRPRPSASSHRTSSRPPPVEERKDNGEGDSGLIKVAGLIKSRAKMDHQKAIPILAPPKISVSSPHAMDGVKDMLPNRAAGADDGAHTRTPPRNEGGSRGTENMLIQELISDVTEENLAEPGSPANVERNNQPLTDDDLSKRGVSIGRSIDSFKDHFPEHVVQAYKEFCMQHGKPYDKARLPNFQYNFLQAEHHSKESGKPIELNEYADLSQEEYTEMNTAMNTGTSEPSSIGTKKTETDLRKPIPSTPKATTASIKQPAGGTSIIKKPKITFHEEPIESSTTFPSTAELYRLKMEEDKRKEEEEEQRMLREAWGQDAPAPNPPSEAKQENLIAKREEEDRLKAEEVARAQAEEAKAEEEARLKAEMETRLKAEIEAKLRKEAEAKIALEMRMEVAEEAAKLRHDAEAPKIDAKEEIAPKEEEPKLSPPKDKRRIKADYEANRIFEEEARRREAEAARVEAAEKRLRELKDKRLKEEIQAKIKADEEERQRYEEKKRNEAAAEARRMAEEASRLLSSSTAYPPSQNEVFEVFEQGPSFGSSRGQSPKLNRLLKNLSGFLGNEEAGEEPQDLEDFSEQADELLAEAKKITDKEEERIRQIKAETAEWKRIQKSLELEAAARKTGKRKKEAPEAVNILDSFQKPSLDATNEADIEVSNRQAEGKERDSILKSVLDGFLYVRGEDQDAAIEKTESISAYRENSKIEKNGQEITPENVPVLSRWRQNPENRSITGFVRNSSEFDNGTEITISTARADAKSGTVVTSLSGRQYKLT